jgi:hypothetical protein
MPYDCNAGSKSSVLKIGTVCLKKNRDTLVRVAIEKSSVCNDSIDIVMCPALSIVLRLDDGQTLCGILWV